MPTNWLTTTLGDCADFFSGGTPRKSNANYWGGTIPWFSGKDLKSFYLSDSEDHVTDAGAEAGSRFMPPGTILLLVRGMTLHNDVPIGVLTREATFNQDIKALRARSGVQQPFLAYWLVSQKARLLSTVHAAGHGTGVLATDRLRALELELPPPKEQAAIADVFGLMEDKIEQNRRTGRALEGLARATFKAWFVDFEPVKAKAAGAAGFPGMPPAAFAALPDRLTDSPLGPVPEGWEVRSIAALCEVIDCLHTKKPEQIGEGSRLLLQLNNIRDDGLLDLSNQYLISESDYALWSAKFETRDGDCVITNVGRVGAVAQIPPGVGAALGRNMTGIRHRPEFPYPAFLVQGLLSSAMCEEIVRHTDTGTILSALNVKNIGRLRLVIPGIDLLIAADAALRPIRALMEHGLAESTKLAALRDYLLPRLLSGRVRVRPSQER